MSHRLPTPSTTHCNSRWKSTTPMACNSRRTTLGQNPSTIPPCTIPTWLAGKYYSGLYGPRIRTGHGSIGASPPSISRRVFKLNYTYDLPIGRGRAFLSNMPRPLDLISAGGKLPVCGPFRTASRSPISWRTAELRYRLTDSSGPILLGTYRADRRRRWNWVNNYFAESECLPDAGAYTLGDAAAHIGSVRSPFFFTANLSVARSSNFRPSHEGHEAGIAA